MRTWLTFGVKPYQDSHKFLPRKSVYEVYPKSSAYNDREIFEVTKKLYAKAEEWIAENKAGLGKWVHRSNSTKAWVLLLFPIIREVDHVFKFVWIMATSNTKYHYEYLLPTPTDQPTITAVAEPEVPLESFIGG